MKYIIVDLEATCWEKGTRLQRMEIIEIGAVSLESDGWEIVDEFSSFVRPVAEPVLSDFCKSLTSIRQSDVDAASEFPIVFKAFLDWIGNGSLIVCSWGAYDVNQFRTDCMRHGIDFPDSLFQNHINLKKKFAEAYHIKPCGMKRALHLLDIPLTGTHHRGIDDARNIAKIAQVILPGK